MRALRPLFPRCAFFAVLATGLATLAACDSGGEIQSGIDYQQLLDTPTEAEVQAVRDDWAGRSNPARDAQVVDTARVDAATLYVVSHTQTGADGVAFTHYGLVRIPDSAEQALPVIVYHHEGDDGLRVSRFLDVLDLFPGLAASTVVVAPVYRAETLVADTLLAGTYAAGGTPSPWDRDVDDAIGLLNVALELFPDATEETQIGALGLDRGGNTALLHAVRDDRVSVVTDYFGPSDFFNAAAAALFRGAMADSADALDFPGIAYLTDTVLDPLEDGTRAYEDARLDLVRRSPGLFGASLPDTQVHHHQDDSVVPVQFSAAFAARIERNPVDGVFDATVYSDDLPAGVDSYHDPAAMPLSLPATQQFIARHLTGE